MLDVMLLTKIETFFSKLNKMTKNIFLFTNNFFLICLFIMKKSDL